MPEKTIAKIPIDRKAFEMKFHQYSSRALLLFAVGTFGIAIPFWLAVIGDRMVTVEHLAFGIAIPLCMLLFPAWGMNRARRIADWYEAVITNRRLRVRIRPAPFGFASEISIPLDQISSVQARQGHAERQLGVWSVVVRSTADQVVTIPGIRDPEEVKDAIFSAREKLLRHLRGRLPEREFR